MKQVKKITCLLLAAVSTLWLCACSSGDTTADEKQKIVIAYQYGTAYTPYMIMKKQKLIEKNNPDIEVEWQVLNSGAAITEGLTAGSIDVAAMGIPPCITGISKGAPFRIYSGISSQPQGLLTNDPDIKSLSDITAEDKIAAVNIGSFQHIILAMLAEKELKDAHALDSNIIAMSHPDGMQALLSKSVSCHQTSSPYTIQEAKTEGIYLVSDMTEVYPANAPFIVAVTTEKISKNAAIYEAVVKATDEAINYINNNKEETAALVCEDLGLTRQETLEYLNADGCSFSSDISGIMDMVTFMGHAGFIDNVPAGIHEIAFDNVKGKE